MALSPGLFVHSPHIRLICQSVPEAFKERTRQAIVQQHAAEAQPTPTRRRFGGWLG
jgi:hypothetical protein